MSPRALIARAIWSPSPKNVTRPSSHVNGVRSPDVATMTPASFIECGSTVPGPREIGADVAPFHNVIVLTPGHGPGKYVTPTIQPELLIAMASPSCAPG